jgi:hypothetical protein
VLPRNDQILSIPVEAAPVVFDAYVCKVLVFVGYCDRYEVGVAVGANKHSITNNPWRPSSATSPTVDMNVLDIPTRHPPGECHELTSCISP